MKPFAQSGVPKLPMVRSIVLVKNVPNLWLNQSQESFVVGTVRAQVLSRFRCPATAYNGAG
jgi:hypothetical protein